MFILSFACIRQGYLFLVLANGFHQFGWLYLAGFFDGYNSVSVFVHSRGLLIYVCHASLAIDRELFPSWI
jgi:hypothetical protein